MSNHAQFSLWHSNDEYVYFHHVISCYGGYILIKEKFYEIISIFYKEKPTYNPQMTFGKPYKSYKSTTKKIGEVYGSESSQHRDNPDGSRFPKMILYFKTERGLHPTQKPVALLEYLIKTYTNENDTVLDFTMGSGSTGVAAKNLNRQFIGIELDKNYFDMAEKRINETR